MSPFLNMSFRPKWALAALIWLTILLWGFLTLLASLSTPSSPFAYLVFSAVFLGLVVTGTFQRKSYGYFFLSLFLWLGFWLKYTLHILLNYPFVEPVGNFYGAGYGWYRSDLISPVSYSIGEKLNWDAVLWASSCGAIGIVLAFFVFSLFTKRRAISPDRVHVPYWYARVRCRLWFAVVLTITAAAITNSVLGIHQIGLVPRTVLPWPLNALLSWWVSMGAAIAVGTMVYWDMKIGKSLVAPICAVLFEGFLSTVSLLSRGVYIFHVLPQLLALCGRYREIVGLGRKQIALLIPIGIVLLLLSVVVVTTLRTQLYARESRNAIPVDVPTASPSPNTADQRSWQQHILDEVIAEMKQRITSGQAMQKQLSLLIERRTELEGQQIKAFGGGHTLKSDFLDSVRSVFRNLAQLAGDRWIGIEGVMAVQAYEAKSGHAFLAALTERREIGKLTSYQIISNSPYSAMRSHRNQFAALPGSTAFFLLSGSLWAVTAGMLVLGLVLLAFERLVLLLTSNPLQCALVGLAMANTIAQMGLSPRQDIPYYAMICVAILAIYAVQSRLLSVGLTRLKLQREAK